MAQIPQRPAFQGILLIGLLVTGFLGACSRTPDADIILLNGRIYTLDWGDPARDGTPAPDAPVGPDGWHPDAEAAAIADGRILSVGTNEEIEAYRAPHTWVKDLAGATVIPGLVDSHTHVAGLGENISRVDLRGVETEQDVVERLMPARDDHEPGEWIIGYGWDEGAWANRYPNWDLLSERFPNHPVLLRSLHGFATWGNRLAFERAGITAATEPPTGGEIVKDAAGNLTGILLNRASGMLGEAIPEPDVQQIMSVLRAGLVAMTEGGYVAVHDAGLDTKAMEALEALESDGELPARA